MPRLAVVPGSRPRLPRAAVAEQAIEVQVALRDVRTGGLWGAAFKTGDPELIESCKTLDAMLRATIEIARQVAGLAEPTPPAAEAAERAA